MINPIGQTDGIVTDATERWYATMLAVSGTFDLGSAFGRDVC